MNCPDCGREYNGAVCRCGYSETGDVVRYRTVAVLQNYKKTDAKTEKKKGKKHRTVIIAIAGICLCLAAVITAAAVSHSRSAAETAELTSRSDAGKTAQSLEEISNNNTVVETEYKTSAAAASSKKTSEAPSTTEKPSTLKIEKTSKASSTEKPSTLKNEKTSEAPSTIKKPSGLKIGDKFKFGSYEQDNNPSNGKEEIEWIVLDVEGNKALIISEYALDSQPYNIDFVGVTWETCSLRKWMNGTFYKAAFSKSEQEMIRSSKVTADKNPEYDTDPGNDTTDKVFLLSGPEAEKYFTTDESRRCAPTAYAKAQGAWTNEDYKTASGEVACWWWLRSPGGHQYDAARVSDDGSVTYRGRNVDAGGDCVRPAMWINL